MEALWHHSCDLTLQFLKLLAFFVAMNLPATWVCLRRISGLSLAARLGIGAAAGFALFVVGAWYIGIWSLDYLLGFWIAQFPLAAWLGRRTRTEKPDALAGQAKGAATEPDSNFSNSASTRGAASGHDDLWSFRSWPVLVPLLLGVVLQLYALHFSILPHGVDASFHCVVGQRQLDAGMVATDLWPLEKLKLNYPIGSHLWLAVASRWTGLAVHEVFRHSFAVALCGASLMIAAWAERLYGTVLHGAAAAFAFLFCSSQASLLPYTWGGLPSLMAMWLGMAALFCVIHLRGLVGLSLSALLFAGTAMVHHHTMVAVLGGSAVVAAFGCIISIKQRPVWRRVLMALAAGSLLAAGYIVPLLTHVADLNRTAVLKFSEPFGWPWDHLWSWHSDPLSRAFTLINAIVTLIALALALRFRPQSAPRGSWALLLGLTGVWLLSFCTLDYGIRLLARAMNRPSTQPFTPSRFVFDIQFILAILVGGGLVRIWDWLRRPAFRYALACALACGAVLQIEPRWTSKLDDTLMPLGRWADKNLPCNALVTGSPSLWVTYAFHRESTSLFIPISDSAEPNRAEIKSTLKHNPNALPWPEWRKRLGKSIYVIGYAYDENATAPLLVVFGPYAIYDMNTN